MVSCLSLLVKPLTKPELCSPSGSIYSIRPFRQPGIFRKTLAGMEPQREGDNVESCLQYQLFMYIQMHVCTYMYCVSACVANEGLELRHAEDGAPYKDKSCRRIRLSAG